MPPRGSYQAVYRSRFGEEADRPDVVYPLPVFGARDGKFTSHYSLTYIEIAQMVPGVPPLTPAQHEAIGLLMSLAEELSFEMRLEPGDMQLVNNHVIDERTGDVRLLYRLWLFDAEQPGASGGPGGALGPHRAGRTAAAGSDRPPRREPPGRPRAYFLAVSPSRVSSTSRTSLTASRHRLLSGAVS